MLRVLVINTLVKPVLEKRWLWGLFLAIWILNALFLGNSVTARSLFFLCGLTVFTIPHGAADCFIPAWILNPLWITRWSYWLPALAAIGILVTATLGLWQLSPDFSMALFTALIIWHWGSLDNIPVFPLCSPSWVVGAIGRGMLVFFAPLYFKPLETRDLILSLTGADQSHILSTLYSFSGYLLALGIVLELLAVVVHKFVEGHGLPAAFAAHWAESIALLITFAWVHPVVSITFYFLMLHPVRHITRLPAYIPEVRGQIVERVGLLKNLTYYFQKTNLITFLAVLILCAWFAWKIVHGYNLAQASIACLLPLLLLLIPHSLVSLLADLNPKQFEA